MSGVVRLKYAKPHLPYDQQLRLLAGRGLRHGDEREAIAALRSIGYYRLSAYTYVLREPGTPIADGERPPRADTFIKGARFEDAVALCHFDHDLRLCLLDALQHVEVGMRVQIGYQLGKTAPFGHLDRNSLNRDACARPGRNRSNGMDAYDDWRTRFDALHTAAHDEEYVKHFHRKYEGQMPVWVATECMDFGCLTYLFHLIPRRDSAKIADNLDIRDPDLLHKWLKALNVLRNNCAHNARVWNRSTVYPPKKPPKNLTHERLHHLRRADPNKLYFLAAITGHLAITLRPSSNWPRQFKTRMRKFPMSNGMTPENTMGFVEGWSDLPLWNYDPASTR